MKLHTELYILTDEKKASSISRIIYTAMGGRKSVPSIYDVDVNDFLDILKTKLEESPEYFKSCMLNGFFPIRNLNAISSSLLVNVLDKCYPGWNKQFGVEFIPAPLPPIQEPEEQEEIYDISDDFAFAWDALADCIHNQDEASNNELMLSMHSSLSRAFELSKDPDISLSNKEEFELANCVISMMRLSNDRGYDIGNAILMMIKHNI